MSQNTERWWEKKLGVETGAHIDRLLRQIKENEGNKDE